jgi:beta-glucosidase
MTHNEPWCVSILGHRSGEHAPGLKDVGTSLRVAHHVLLSHGRAVPVIRALAPRAEVGIVLNLVPGEPASPSAADLEATRRFDGEFNRWFCDPLFHARYPADAVEDYRKAGVGGVLDDLIQPGDLAEIAVPTDFLGVNYYSRLVLRSNAIPESENLPRVVHLEPEQTDMGWEVKAEGLGMLLDRIHRDWGPKRIYIAENGCAYGDAPGADGRVPELGPDRLPEGDYRLEFQVGPYFAASGRPTFYPRVTIEFIVADADSHYHVPLLLSPFGYSTYRGS